MSRRCYRNSLLLFLFFLLPASAQTVAAAKAEKKEPIVITARRMEAERLGSKVTFLGDVTLKKEDISLYSDYMVVFYDETTNGISEIEARGNVVVRREGRTALADRAYYYSKEEKIVLTGDARIIENENQIGGDRITLFVRDDRSIVERGEVLFYQEKDKKKGD